MANGVGIENAVVLVVDDDVSLRLIIRSTLEPGGFTVVEADNGQVALTVFNKVRPDIVLMDIMMPEMDGFAACKALRDLPSGWHVPIVMMTGLDDTESIERSYEAGATDFVTKPINYLLLSHRMNYVLRAKRTADHLRRSQTRLSNAQRIARIGHWEWDAQSQAVHCSNGIREIFGVANVDPFLGIENYLARVHPDDRELARHKIERGIKEGRHYSLPIRISRPDGSERIVYQETEFNVSRDGEISGAISTVQDITEQKHSEEKVRYLSHYDSLTGLPNRVLFSENLKRAVANGSRYQRSVVVLLLDLDNFRRINQTLGFHAGDEVLKEVAERLSSFTRAGDVVSRDAGLDITTPDACEDEEVVARFGGDEFVILLSEIARVEDAVFVAKRIRKAFALPFNVEGSEVYLTVSIGISAYPVDGLDAGILLKHAQVAVNHAKKKGPSQYQFYKQSLDAWARRRLSIETQLRKAIEKEEFEVYYQPRLNIQQDKVVAMEALVRWRHPERGLVWPAEFISIAEETGVILPLGEWVLHRACAETMRLHKMGLNELIVSVNLSAAQFRQKRPVQHLTRILTNVAIDPCFVELELTEGLLLEDRSTSLNTLAELREFGLSIAVDDFGTGYSSLSYLKRLPVNALKIDQSFVQGVDTDKRDAAITEAIIRLAHSLELKLIAEGVERPGQLTFLHARSCDEVQGYLICQPLTAERFAEWVSSESCKTASMLPPPLGTAVAVEARR
ncbi:MAG: EAL domain-containing protein [Gammaproteobacteria bacterium]|nr:EAL domain-containing protein [Gammaproteobacteria bacterium]